MSTYRVIFAVFGLRNAVPVLLIGIALAITSAARTPDELVYASVPSVAPAALVIGASVMFAGAMLSVPRTDAGEVTAARSLWFLRSTLAGTIGAAAVIAAAGVCLILDFWWFLAPLVRGSLVIAAMTLATGVIVPRIYITLLPGAYLLSCLYLSHGEKWWDLVLTHPNRFNLIAAAVVSFIGLAAFAVFGSRSLSPEDET
jgi:hypothetical protein